MLNTSLSDTLTGLSVYYRTTNLFAFMARLIALTTVALYFWGSSALRTAVIRVVWFKVFAKRTVRYRIICCLCIVSRSCLLFSTYMNVIVTCFLHAVGLDQSAPHSTKP